MEGVPLSRVDYSNLNNREISSKFRLNCELSIEGHTGVQMLIIG